MVLFTLREAQSKHMITTNQVLPIADARKLLEIFATCCGVKFDSGQWAIILTLFCCEWVHYDL